MYAGILSRAQESLSFVNKSGAGRLETTLILRNLLSLVTLELVAVLTSLVVSFMCDL